MISRRGVVKLGSTGLVMPSLSSIDSTVLNSIPLSKVQEQVQESDVATTIQGPSLEKPIIVRWRFDVAQVLNTVPLFYENLVLFGTGAPHYTTDSGAGTFWALDSDSGEVLWSLPSQATWWSQPTISDEVIYVGSALVGYDAHHSEYHAIELATGTELWRLDFEGPMRATTDIIDDLMVIETTNPDPYAPGEPGTYIVEKSTGAILWTLQDAQGWVNRDTDDRDTKYPILNGNIIVKNDNGLVALDIRTAQEAWRFDQGTRSEGIVVGNTAVIDFSEGISAIDLETGTETWRLRASAYLAGHQNNIVVAQAWRENGFILLGIDLVLGEILWTKDLDGGYRDLHLVDEAIFLLGYYDDEDLLCRFDIKTGELVWQQSVSEDFETIVYDEGIIVAGGFNQPIRAFDPGSGQLMWQTEENIGSDAFVNLTDQLILVSESTPDFIGLDRTSGKVQFRYKFSSGGDSTHPGIGNGLWVVSGTSDAPVIGLGNMPPIKLLKDTEVRGAPSPSAVVRGTEGAGTEINLVGSREVSSDGTWVEVMINSTTGWIPLESVDPTSLPPEGEIEIIYMP